MSCSFAAGSIGAYVQHLDKMHPFWVDWVLSRYGFTIPPSYPIPEYKAALTHLIDGAIE